MVNFDAGDDAFTDKKIGEVLAVVGVLMGSFVEENNTVDVVFKFGGSEEEVTVVAAVIVGVGDAETGEFFVDAAARFVSGENAFGR